jgi:hypothetical protein
MNMNDKYEKRYALRYGTKKVTITTYDEEETFTIMPMGIEDYMLVQSAIKYDTGTNERTLQGDIAARVALNSVAKYTQEFSSVNFRAKGHDTLEEYIDVYLDPVAINQLSNAINEFTAEIREKREAEIQDAAETAVD